MMQGERFQAGGLIVQGVKASSRGFSERAGRAAAGRRRCACLICLAAAFV